MTEMPSKRCRSCSSCLFRVKIEFFSLYLVFCTWKSSVFIKVRKQCVTTCHFFFLWNISSHYCEQKAENLWILLLQPHCKWTESALGGWQIQVLHWWNNGFIYTSNPDIWLGYVSVSVQVPREWVRLEGTSGGHLIYTDEVVPASTHIKMQ